MKEFQILTSSGFYAIIAYYKFYYYAIINLDSEPVANRYSALFRVEQRGISLNGGTSIRLRDPSQTQDDSQFKTLFCSIGGVGLRSI